MLIKLILCAGKKRQPIAVAELLAAFCAVKSVVGSRRDVDILLFVDNTAAEMALRKGSSTDVTMCTLSHEFHKFCAERNVRVWSSYVPSEFNPADEPSRSCTVNSVAAPRRFVSEFTDLGAVEHSIRCRGGRYYALL